MNILEDFKAECFEIRNVPALDPVAVYVRDMGMQRGHITVTCFGAAWTAYFGAMGCDSVEEFISKVSGEYLCNKTAPPSNQTKAQEKYRRRVKDAVIEAIAARQKANQVTA